MCIFRLLLFSKLNMKNYPSYRTIYNSVLNIGQWLNSSSKDGTKYHAISIHPKKYLTCFSFVGRNMSILLTLTIMCFTCLIQLMDETKSFFFFFRFCKNTFILTSSLFKRLSIWIKNNRLSYCIILSGFWSNVFFNLWKFYFRKTNIYI